MRIALVSPLPPAATGVADYALRLFEGLRQAASGDSPIFELVDGATVTPARLAEFDLCLYQIGNNTLHAATYRAAIETPGIVVLHDAMLHHLMLGMLSEEDYLAEFVYNYGGWYQELAGELWRDRAHCVAQERFFRYPMLRRLVESSRAVVVHNPKAARLAREALRGAERTVQIVTIPHYVEIPPLTAEGEVAAKRGELGISAQELVVSCFGFMRPTKRLHSLLRAARLSGAHCRVLIAGNFVSAEYEASLRELMRPPAVIRLPYVSEPELWLLAALTDICVNLRYPSVGESSGIAAKLMAAGKPVLITEGEEHEEMPQGARIGIDAGEAEVEMLACILHVLAGDAEMRRSIGTAAAAHMRDRHSLGSAAQAYLDVIRYAIGH